MTRDYVYRHQVTLEETNLVGNVYFAHYVRWQGHCRERFLADNAPGVLAALSTGFTMVTTACSCEFLDELTANDRVELRMTLRALDVSRGDQEPVVQQSGDEDEIACPKRAEGGAEGRNEALAGGRRPDRRDDQI